MLYADVINLFAIRKCQNIQKLDENSSYWQRKSSYRPKDLRNVNKIFGNPLSPHSLFRVKQMTWFAVSTLLIQYYMIA